MTDKPQDFSNVEIITANLNFDNDPFSFKFAQKDNRFYQVTQKNGVNHFTPMPEYLKTRDHVSEHMHRMYRMRTLRLKEENEERLHELRVFSQFDPDPANHDPGFARRVKDVRHGVKEINYFEEYNSYMNAYGGEILNYPHIELQMQDKSGHWVTWKDKASGITDPRVYVEQLRKHGLTGIKLTS